MSDDADENDGEVTDTARDLFSGSDSPAGPVDEGETGEEIDAIDDMDDRDATDDPFEELEPVEDDGIPSEELDDLFESVETSDLDEEAVWEAVLSDGEEMVDPDLAGAGADAVVPKDQYCRRCEFFSDPPDVACTNPGTEIEELVGIDDFRVRNCPVVARRGRAKTVFADEE